ncbi:MAG: 2-amino-4-oxopentanoate thiolase subunit OrtB [Spirochaetaceae bacterium]
MNRTAETYESLMARKGEIIKRAVGIDYSLYESGSIAFDYEALMRSTGYSLQEIRGIQRETGVGETPLLELRNLTGLTRGCAAPGKGARIFIKDEAAHPSGSFKARRAATSVYHAKKLGFKGVIAATSGNYGAAVASQAAMRGLDCIVVQECFDSRGVGQPEIIEKARKCEAFGAEVVQLSVGPELFYIFLSLLEETGFFNASLYTPFGVAGIETLGAELDAQMKKLTGRAPDAVVVTNAGGGNLTGTARGLASSAEQRSLTDTEIIAASVNLEGLNMASDREFNLKSFTTGHTGFGIPFSTFPDRSDVPRSAARPLRYMDRYVTVRQGEVFYTTEALARLEGLERGPAGNIALAAAFALAQEMDQDQTIVVQETEYTGAGKHVQPQLAFARDNGIQILIGDPRDEVPGRSIILPREPGLIRPKELDLEELRHSYIRHSVEFAREMKKRDAEKADRRRGDGTDLRFDKEDIRFLAEETKSTPGEVDRILKALGLKER